MLSGTGYPSGENYPAGTGMELFFTRMRVRITRRVKFYGYGYGWTLPVRYVPVAILSYPAVFELWFVDCIACNVMYVHVIATQRPDLSIKKIKC
jgi:hypothetical protein